MASNLMASFGEDFVETNIMSETNSVHYWLDLIATHTGAVPNQHRLQINQKDTGGAPGHGINIWQINTSVAEVTPKTFDLTQNDSTMNTAFVEYMKTKTSGLYVIMTHGRCHTSPSVTNWFRSKKSVVFPESRMTDMFPLGAYCAIFAGGKNAILYESYMASDGIKKEDTRAMLSTVYDTVGEVGLVGFPSRAFEDGTTYRDSTGYEYRRYPEQDKTISKLQDFGLQQNLDVRFTCDLYASQALITAGSTTRAELRWFNGTTLVSATPLSVPSSSPNKWIRFENDYRIPSNVNGFTVVVSRYPKTTATAESIVRNVMMVQISGPAQVQSATQAEFGVNGIRMNRAIEGGNNGSTTIFELPNPIVDSSGDRHAKEFREKQ